MEMKMAAWFNVEVVDRKSPIASCGLYMYARKSFDGEKVIVHNGHHFIQHYTKEEARKLFKLNRKMTEKESELQEHDFQYYLHY